MTIEEIERIVARELESYSYEKPAPEATIGVAWSEEKVLSYIPKLKKALVTPRLRQFRVTTDAEYRGTETFEDYWIVAEDHGYVQWYDPKSNEFGLGEESAGGGFSSIGVRGDLVGVYCAM